jgi:hypothetical protein
MDAKRLSDSELEWMKKLTSLTISFFLKKKVKGKK